MHPGFIRNLSCYLKMVLNAFKISFARITGAFGAIMLCRQRSAFRQVETNEPFLSKQLKTELPSIFSHFSVVSFRESNHIKIKPFKLHPVFNQYHRLGSIMVLLIYRGHYKRKVNIKKKILTGYAWRGKRKRGRPRNTWRRTVESEMNLWNETWGTITRKAQNRLEWRSFVAALIATRQNRH